MSGKPIHNEPQEHEKNAILDALSGHNRVVILFGAFLGIAAAFAASKGLITSQSAIPSFGWIVFGLLVFELAYGAIKNAPPSALISMPGRVLALVVGVGIDILVRKILGVAL